VSLENDYGKDAYIDFGGPEGVLGVCASAQIKSGTSYTTAEGYKIPCDANHAEIWKSSTVPALGIVHDPERKQLFWINISDYLRTKPIPLDPAYVPVPRKNLLTAQTLRFELIPSVVATARLSGGANTLLSLCADNEPVALAAIMDCLGLARSDIRALIILRHLVPMLSGDPLRAAIYVLSCATAHPDRIWHDGNWLAKKHTAMVQRHFRWTSAELVRMFREIDLDQWERGGEGQDLWMLLHGNEVNFSAIEEAIPLLLATNELDAAYSAAIVAIDHADSQLEKCESILRRFPRLSEHGAMLELHSTIYEHGHISLFS
jgi:hypothetical protein